MLIIPAIDLKDGQCVRLLQGRAEDKTVYSNDPARVASKWESMGARLLHIVDLDGAFTGMQRNFEVIKAIRRAVKMEIEVGGGIRNIEGIDALISMGINRVILGTVAVEKPELVEKASIKYPGMMLVGIDARDGKAAVRGWVETTEIDASMLALEMEGRGAAGIIYTDISRDGMLTGPNIGAMRRMVETVKIPVIASGGISRMDDIKMLMEIKGLWGAITGKAIYSGALDLKEAISYAEEKGK
jgi:phosphoribosylformimino-5-aminoimidazole carboxamide ribotide isomerase